uniref:RBR-type E3 ubiquitin transferase n=1 Tax=Anabas testudineus TaxID=64144 RepID=A0A3Q1JNH1_ANATE
MNTDSEEQEDELLALDSIFGSGEFVRNESKSSGEIRVSVELPANFTVVLKEGQTLRKYEISFLPPLLLNFELPEHYPSSSPPSFTLTCSWLTNTQLSALTAQLLDLYQALGGTVVLFSWVQFLKEDALTFLDIQNVLELPNDEEPLQTEDEILSGLTPSQILMSQILIYNADQKQKVFDGTVFECSVCFMVFLGSVCVQLSECGHVFCRACLAEFCKVQITEGNVEAVTCPQADCTASPTPAQVKSLVGDDLFSRYDRLLLQSSLDQMPDVVYCPRLSCGSAVIREQSGTAALCSVCRFAFCVTCRKTYHGPDDCMGKKQQTALLDDYANGSKERKQLLEKRYGQRILLVTVEEIMSEQWLATNTQNCPHCYSKIQVCIYCGFRRYSGLFIHPGYLENPSLIPYTHRQNCSYPSVKQRKATKVTEIT